MRTEKKLEAMLSNIRSKIKNISLNELLKNIFNNIKRNKSYINIIKSFNIVFINICTHNINNARSKTNKSTKNFNILSIFRSYKFFKNLS